MSGDEVSNGMHGVEIRFAHLVDDRASLVDIYRIVYPAWGFNQAIFDWRYAGVPGGPAKILLAIENEKLISKIAVMPRDLTIDGERVSCLVTADVMTHPICRGRGIFRAISQAMNEYCRGTGLVTCGYPNEFSYRGFSQTGWRDLHPIPWLTTTNMEPGGDEAGLEEIGPDDIGDWVEALWLSTGRVGVHRDKAYVEWRLARPDAEYRIFAPQDRSALVIFKFFERECPRMLNICELLAAPKRLDLVRAALAVARRLAREESAVRITTWSYPTEEMWDTILGAGYVPEEHRSRVAHAWTPPGTRSGIDDTAPWHLAQLDADPF